MPKKSTKSPDSQSPLTKRIRYVQKQELDKFSTNTHVLFEFLALVIDIKYRHKYLKSFDNKNRGAYSVEGADETTNDTT